MAAHSLEIVLATMVDLRSTTEHSLGLIFTTPMALLLVARSLEVVFSTIALSTEARLLEVVVSTIT